MANKNFPPEFKNLMKAEGVKAAFVSDIVSLHPDHCINCGGAGILYIFIATIGPMTVPVVGKNISTHFSDGKWWGGRGFTFPCPDCKGMSATRPSVAPQQVQEAVEGLVDDWTNV